uniref:Uncharacterized protein n=1 Tax=Anguilla anguilla TaxID=7936 RepID=A0A0E9TW98_ANGAN
MLSSNIMLSESVHSVLQLLKFVYAVSPCRHSAY